MSQSNMNILEWMKKKSDLYESCIGRAIRTRRMKGGPSKEEVNYYADAMDICDEIKKAFSTNADIVAKWERKKLECEEKGNSILVELGYTEEPKDTEAPANASQTPSRSQGEIPTSSQSKATVTKPSSDTRDPRPITETESGFKTRNATQDLPATTIEGWYKQKPNHGLDDLVGMDDVVKKLNMIAGEMGLTKTDEILKMSPDKGILLYGFHGNGKTHTIEAFVNYRMTKDPKTKFIHLKGSEIISPYVGEAGKILAAAFQEAIDNAPAVLFFDELDNICPSRNQTDQSHQQNLTNAFLESYNQLVASKKSVVVFGATNNPWKVDVPASNRFKIKVLVPLPSEEARKNYLKNRFENVCISDDLTFEDIAADTDNFDFRDLGSLCEGMAAQLRQAAIQLHDLDNLTDEQKDEIISSALKDGKVMLNRKDYEFVRSMYSASVTEEERQLLDEYIRSL